MSQLDNFHTHARNFAQACIQGNSLKELETLSTSKASVFDCRQFIFNKGHKAEDITRYFA